MKPFLILMLMILMSCASKAPIQPQDPIVITPPTDVIIDNGEPNGPIIVPAPVKPYVVVKKCTNCNLSQAEFIKNAVVKVNETVAGSCFSEFLIARKMNNTNAMTSAEVVKTLIGANVFTDTEMYFTNKKVLGYTLTGQSPDKYKIWINSRYMESWGLCDLASLIGHEVSHKIGFGHGKYATSSRPYSVPYSVNAAFSKCCVR